MVQESEHMFEEIVPEDIECDIIVRMPPIKEQTIRAKIKSAEKATLHIVEPEVV